MEKYHLCQSCGMPIESPAMRGTERDGSQSRNYCKYCYQDGAFTDPEISFDEMKANLLYQMKERHIPDKQINDSLNNLHNLRRWRNNVHIL